METQIVYKLPETDDICRAAFKSMKRLLNCSQLSDQADSFTLSASGLFPVTVFECTKIVSHVDISLRSALGETSLPLIFPSHGKNADSMLSFYDAEKILTGKILAIDHTGLCLPTLHMKETDWIAAVNILAADTMLYDYPVSPEYNSQRARWFFSVPFLSDEASLSPSQTRRRQPKFELVWDIDAPHETILQIDVETNLNQKNIIDLLPTSYELPGLGDFFRSVNIQSPWPGISFVRLDLRYQDDGELNEWNSAQWLIEKGRRIHRDSAREALLPRTG